jgi:hypothetical protein
MRLRGSIACVVVGLTVWSGAAPASAEPAQIAIDDATPTLKHADDGDWSGTLGLTNLTDEALSLSAAPTAADPACKPRLSKAAIGSAQSSEAKLTVPKACTIKDATFELTLTAAGPSAPQHFQVVAEAKADDDDPDWSLLAWFFYALPFIGVCLGLVFLRKNAFNDKLTHLEATYSFSESWVSNITVLGGLLTGVFGSADVVKAFLGEDAESAVALATVGSAIALVLIGSGPIFLNALKADEMDGDKLVGQPYTVGGLLLATTVTVAGAFGQLFVGWQSARTLDLGGAEDLAVFGFAAAVALLAWYTLATVGSTISAGTTEPPSPAPSGVEELASLLEDALRQDEHVPNEAIPGVVQNVMSTPIIATRTADVRRARARRRSAMP